MAQFEIASLGLEREAKCFDRNLTRLQVNEGKLRVGLGKLWVSGRELSKFRLSQVDESRLRYFYFGSCL
jgi:hypothetical protein